MDSTFVRKDFYLAPPAKDAGPEEWKNWLRKEALKARGAKAAFTRQQKAQECDDPRLSRSGLVKIGGVWRSSVAVWSGSAEEGTLTREVAVDAPQEEQIEAERRAADTTHKRGNKRKNRNRNRRAKARSRRKAQYQC